MSVLEVTLKPEILRGIQEEAAKRKIPVAEIVGIALEEHLRARQETESAPSKRSVMEFMGVGRATWQDVDVDQYINDLRDEWDQRP